jgi:ATP synthase protein I
MASNDGEKSKQDTGQNTDDDAALRARLDELGRALEAQRNPSSSADAGNSADLSGQSVGRAMSLGFRVLTEFVAAIVVGTLIGWQLDVWLATGPVFLIVFLALGTAAGFLGVYRIAVGSTGSKGDQR